MKIAPLCQLLEERTRLQGSVTDVGRPDRTSQSKSPNQSGLESVIEDIDKELSSHINKILHHRNFLKLEATLRGLHFLVRKKEISDNIKIRISHSTKLKLLRTFRKFEGDRWDTNPLLREIYQTEFGACGGEPYGCLLGDYTFDHSENDITTLRGVATIAAAAHVPFITSPAPSLFGLSDWTEINNPLSLKPSFDRPEYSEWRSFRSSDDAKYIGMAMPRFPGRAFYHPETNSAHLFKYEGELNGLAHEECCCVNSAYAMGANIIRSFNDFGISSQIRGAETGGAVEGLPTHAFSSGDGSSQTKRATEVMIGDRRERDLSDLGMLPLFQWKNTDYAVFIGGQSLQEPPIHRDEIDSSHAVLAARLPYLFLICRFVHYLKMIAREEYGFIQNAAQLEDLLREWISRYVYSGAGPSNEAKIQFPLTFEARTA